MKKMRWLVAILVTGMVLAACGGGSTQTAGGGSVDSKGHMTLDFWYALSGDPGKAVEELVKRFNESQSNITVVATYQGDYTTAMAKIYTSITGGSVPNVVQVGGAPLLGSSGVVISMDELIQKDSSFDINLIRPAFIEYNKAGGTLWSMPFNNSLPVLYYNKDLFTTAGLDPEKPPANLDELLVVGQKLTIDKDNTGTPSQWGLNTREDTHWYLSTLFLENGAKIVSDDESQVLYNSPEAVSMLQLWSDWVNKYKIMPINQHNESQSDFLAGKLGMLLGSSAMVTSLQSSVSFKLGVAMFPAVGTTRMLPIGGGSLAIFKNKDDRLVQASWEFVKFMVSKESSIYLAQ